MVLSGEPEHLPQVDDSLEPGDVEAVIASEAFQHWLDVLPSVDVDGERLFLPTRDVPQDQRELATEWLRQAEELKRTDD